MNKKICKNCVRLFVKNQNLDYKKVWTNNDDDDWEDGFIICPYKKDGTPINDYMIRKSNRIVPDGCKYRLEHLISEQKL